VIIASYAITSLVISALVGYNILALQSPLGNGNAPRRSLMGRVLLLLPFCAQLCIVLFTAWTTKSTAIMGSVVVGMLVGWQWYRLRKPAW